MSEAKRLKKKWSREHRISKRYSWRCSNCGNRHPHGQRCPVPSNKLTEEKFAQQVEKSAV